jgi:hypothetical protein
MHGSRPIFPRGPVRSPAAAGSSYVPQIVGRRTRGERTEDAETNHPRPPFFPPSPSA